jgi:serine/threonine protein kinase
VETCAANTRGELIIRERDIFIEALQQGDPALRAAHLDDACQGDVTLRRQVERLLAEHERQESFILDSPPADLDLTAVHRAIAERPGTVIGPYKLLQQIGEGGMGIVFMAEQCEPLQRTVALKIIKPGMDTRQVIARFEAERQALAMMDHPNIAKVLDAGTTDSGRPYFVMELVKGVPITKYCDDKRLPLRARLELLLPVCQAVQHAHHKGVIHRDIKPTNVLVAEYDDHAVPKVIDFGVAKATAQKLTEHTLFTEFGQIVGTVEYMSPEQAKLNQLDIDTRSDIYSLGVLMYELLTGSTPFGRKRLQAAAFDEMLRIIREEEPPKPSTRLSTAEGLPSIATNRSSEPLRLNRLVRGELDWMVMKALEKDRNRRYETANGFAADIQRYLNEEAVEACPPSAAYRFRKFARRNKRPVLAASLILLALIVGMFGTTIGLIRAEKARQAEAEQRQLAEANEQKALAALAAEKSAKQTAEARKAQSGFLLDFLENRIFGAAVPEGQQEGMARELALRKALLEDSLRFYDGFLQRTPLDPSIRFETARILKRLSTVQRDLGRGNDAGKSLERSVELLSALVTAHPDEPTYREQLADAHNYLAFTIHTVPSAQLSDEAEAHLRQALRLYEELEHDFPQRPQTSAGPMKLLADIIYGRDPVEGERLYRQAIAQIEVHVEHSPGPEKWLELSWARFSLAAQLDDPGPGFQPVESEKLHLQAIEAAEKELAIDPQSNAARFARSKISKELGDLYDRTGRSDEAIPLYSKALQDSQMLVSRSPWTAENWAMVREIQVALVDKLQSSGRTAEAKSAVEQLREWLQKSAPLIPDDSGIQNQLRQTQSQIVDLHRFVGATSQADALARTLPSADGATDKDSPRNEDARLAESLDNLGLALNIQWELSEAEAMHRKALAIWKKQPGDEHLSIVRSLKLLADVLQKQGKRAEAEAMLREADQ